MKSSIACALVALLFTAGCGGDDDAPTADAPPGGGPDAPGGGADAGNGTRLLTSSYTIPAGEEFYQCERITVTEDLWIRTITPVNGVGTHHEVFAIDPSPEADGTSSCGPLDNEWIVLFASGVGSTSLSMPDGVALKVPAGSQVVLDLHLFNAGDAELVDSASLDIVTGPPVDADHEAEVVLAGPVLFNIPPGDNQTVNGFCTMNGATNFFAVFPHMHQLGKHIRVRAAGATVYDMDYQFEDQDFASFTPIPLSSGDRIDVTCTYNNTTGGGVTFGDSSTEEMCFAISYRYPRLGNGALGAICSF